MKCVFGRSLTDFLEFYVEEMEAGRVVAEVEYEDEDFEDAQIYHTSLGANYLFVGLAKQLHKAGRFDGRRLLSP